jgi:hypothetical protein
MEFARFVHKHRALTRSAGVNGFWKEMNQIRITTDTSKESQDIIIRNQKQSNQSSID